MRSSVKKNCRVLTKQEVKLIEDVRELKTDVAWIKRFLFLILGVVLANLGALLLKGAP